MQSFAFVIFGSMLFMNSAFAADSLISSHTTHPVLEALPSASPQASFQIARTYYLPDYQQQLDNIVGDRFPGRVADPENNRTSPCSAGGYYNSLLGDGYNCSSVVYAHQACYSCTPKDCPSKQITETTCKAKTNWEFGGWIWTPGNAFSGTETCGTCEENKCDDDYQTSASLCGTKGVLGWTLDKTDICYAGEITQYKCQENTCDTDTYKTDVSQCGETGSKGWNLNTSGGKNCYAGDTLYGTCEELQCNTGYDKGVEVCTPSDGYTLKQDGDRYNGDAVCGYCAPNDCSGYTEQGKCDTNNGYTFIPTCKSGTTVYGECYGAIYIPQPSGISDSAAIRNTSLFNGCANTKAMIAQIGADALAATAANQFYAPGVDKNDANFGQGKWCLPAIGELMEMYGTDASGIVSGYGTSGTNGDNKTVINASLTILKAAGVDCAALTNDYYWSSSEYRDSNSWNFNINNGGRYDDIKNNYFGYVRCFQYLENKFNPKNVTSVPQIGDVMYSDLTYGSANNYNSSKTVVGIVTWVSEDGKSAKIVSLKDLTFSSFHMVGNFNPDDPYNGNYGYTHHTTSAKWAEDITGIDNYNSNQFLAAIQEAVAESAK